MLALGLTACAEPDPVPLPVAAGATSAPASPSADASSEPAAPESGDCARRIAAAEALEAEPGAPGFEARRVEILGRAKAEPVVFRRPPQPVADPGPEVKSLRLALSTSPSPGFSLMGLYKTVRNRPEVARALLLSEGYLFTDVPDLAAAFVDLVELHHLFAEKEIVIQRGSQMLHARKGSQFWFEYTDGPERGQRARLLLLDRVWAAGTDPGPPLHVDLRKVALEAGMERVRIRRFVKDQLLVDARHGNVWVPTLLRSSDGGSARLECEAIPAEQSAEVAAAKQLARRRSDVLAALRTAIVTMVGEALPFDEPRTEEGQQDGNLRPAWRWAYTHGWDSYTFNDDTYLVFDAKGRPKIPQVCIDFVTDTMERASGTWWGSQSSERQRIRGNLDFDDVGIENRRSVDVFIRFAEDHPEWFDVYELADAERIRFFERGPFFGHLSEHADRYLAGDVVAIHGPRSDGENHWHSFFVYDTDPVSGLPTLLASNAGKPRIRSWEGEMRAAPRRSIKTRIRPRLDWLESVIPKRPEVSVVEPPPLISAPI